MQQLLHELLVHSCKYKQDLNSSLFQLVCVKQGSQHLFCRGALQFGS